MFEIKLAITWLLCGRDRVVGARRERPGDRGASIVETVVIIGLFVAAAIVIVGILVNKATSAARSVQIQ